MNPPVEPPQRIARLAPLREVFAAVDGCAGPVAPHDVDAAEAAGLTLAADILAPAALPAAAVALRDGWAVRADLVADAGPYAPVPLAPPPAWVDAGDTLSDGCDAVLPPDAIVVTAGAAEAVAPAEPGEGVLPAGSDTASATLLRAAGDRLRAADIAALRAAGVARVSVRRPRIGVVAANGDAIDTVAPMIAAAMAGEGAAPVGLPGGDAAGLARALDDGSVDAVVTVGGTGQGRKDRTAQIVAARGRLLVHGMGMRPGDSAGLGSVAGRPVLLLPGRFDAALAVWLVVGRRLAARLAGAAAVEEGRPFVLGRKIVSAVGLAEVVLVRWSGEGVEPLAAGLFPLQALARAAGWVLVPPESEGYPAGATITVEPLP